MALFFYLNNFWFIPAPAIGISIVLKPNAAWLSTTFPIAHNIFAGAWLAPAFFFGENFELAYPVTTRAPGYNGP